MKIFWFTGTGQSSYPEAASSPTMTLGHRMKNDVSYRARPAAPYVAKIIEESLVAVERSMALLEMVDVKMAQHLWPSTERLEPTGAILPKAGPQEDKPNRLRIPQAASCISAMHQTDCAGPPAGLLIGRDSRDRVNNGRRVLDPSAWLKATG